MLSSRTIVVAGAGIGGLTAALALTGRGFRVVLFEQAAELEETGAGIQLAPNATRILLALGLGPYLRRSVVVPDDIRVMAAGSGHEVTRIPLGASIEARFGAPYWVVHRSDLQAALAEAVRENPDIELALDRKVVEFASHANGVTVQAANRKGTRDATGICLIGADGLWSMVRARCGDQAPPRAAGRSAWRAVVPAEALPPDFREPSVHLWLQRKSHLVHYPVKGGQAVNIVAIAEDKWSAPGWSTQAAPGEMLERFPPALWAAPARDVLRTPQHWLKWALFDRPARRIWGRGAVTLLGDAAHPMLPFLAQGAAMAIEDAALLAACLDGGRQDPPAALRRYERLRRERTASVQRAARRNGDIYQWGGLDAQVRNFALKLMGGERLLARYDWIYDWRAA